MRPSISATVSEYLTAEDKYALTGFQRSKQQADWLRKNGIPHRVDGPRVIVSHTHVRNWLEGRSVVSGGGIDWSTVR